MQAISKIEVPAFSPKLVLGFMALLLAWIAWSTVVRRVEPGYAGVVVDYGAGTTTGRPAIRTLATGQYVVVNPVLQQLAAYPTSQQSLIMVRAEHEGQVKGDDSVGCQDTNGIPFSVDSTTFWRVDPDQVGDLYLLRPGVQLAGREGADISSLIVRRGARSAITTGCSQYRYDQVYGKQRDAFRETIEQELRKELLASKIVLDQFRLGEVHLKSEQQRAITEKANAEQAALQAAFLRQKAENEAAAAVAKAEGEKQVRIKHSEGEAEAIRAVQEQLGRSPEYIRYLFATRWDGKYPTTLVGQEGMTLLGSVDLTPPRPATGPAAPAGR